MHRTGTSETARNFALACDSASLLSIPVAELDRRIGCLTRAQLDVLELVALRCTSKEIARELGISPVTVDQRIKRAQSILGATSRSEAARFLLAARGVAGQTLSPAYDKTIYRSSGLSEQSQSGTFEPSSGEWNPADDADAHSMMQSQAAYFANPIGETKAPRPLSVLEEIQHPENLTAKTKTFLILAMMIGTLFTVAMLVSLVEGISRLV